MKQKMINRVFFASPTERLVQEISFTCGTFFLTEIEFSFDKKIFLFWQKFRNFYEI